MYCSAFLFASCFNQLTSPLFVMRMCMIKSCNCECNKGEIKLNRNKLLHVQILAENWQFSHVNQQKV